MSSGANGRRVFAWADADAVSNGYSGPSNAISPGSKVAQLNNYASPDGGPPECRWSVNNCGPNDEPFAFHPGGVNATMGDGSVRFLADSIDGVVVKWMVGAEDGQTINESPVSRRAPMRLLIILMLMVGLVGCGSEVKLKADSGERDREKCHKAASPSVAW